MNITPTRPKNRFLVSGAPAIEEAETEEVVASMRSGWFGTGPKVARFIDDFRSYKDAWKRFGDEGYKHYYVFDCGLKYNMLDIQAAIGTHQLARVEAYRKRRQEIWNQYDEAFADLPLGLPADPDHDTRHAHHLYTILIDQEKTGISRNAFLGAMTSQNIGIGVHYQSIPEHPYYQERFGWKPKDYPNAMRIGRQTVSLPSSAKLSDQDVSDVVAAVRRVIAK